MHVQRYVIVVETDAEGDAVAYSPPGLTGRVETIRYVKDDYADTVDFVVTSEATGETVWAQDNVTASTTVAPRQPTHSTAGAPALYADSGEAINDHIHIANDRLKFVIANGGAEKSGEFHLVVS